MSEQTIEQVEQAMASNRVQAERQRREIQNDKNLSDEGKLTKLAEVKNAAFNKHEELKRARSAAVQHEHDAYYRNAFRRGVAAIDSYRAVYSQANAVKDSKELERLLAQAVNTDDTLLLKAVQQVAFDRGFVELLHDAPDAVKALLEFEYDNGLRQSNDPAIRSRQLNKRLTMATSTTAPRWS